MENGVEVDSYESMELAHPAIMELIKNNPDKHYRMAIDGPGNPLTPYEGPTQPTTTGTQTI